MAALSPACLRYIIDHVVLPPQLPQSAEAGDIARAYDFKLVGLLSDQAKAYRQHNANASSQSTKCWQIIEKMLNRFKHLISTPCLSEETLVQALRALQPSDVLPIHLQAQNAVLIIRRHQINVTFECFEASADSASVIAAPGRLVRRFPAHGISIPLTVFEDQKFQQELAFRLSQLGTETVQEMMPQSKKAGKETGEVRDTVHPGLVTEWLMTTLAPLGKAVTVHQITKRTRDDVLWDNCLLPWRRSPMWLSIRVAVQTTLLASLHDGQPMIEYKSFMIFLLTEIASKASEASLPNDICHVVVTKIARRASKMGKDLPMRILDKALQVCQDIRTKREAQWKAVQEQDADRPTTIERRPFEDDTALTLKNSREYLDSVLSQDCILLQDQIDLHPYCAPLLHWSHGLPVFGKMNFFMGPEVIHTLTEFEIWVCHLLPEWTEQRLTSAFSEASRARDCMSLADIAASYRDIALPTYNQIPEQISLMYLTIASLWQALDILATISIPLLRDFSPSIPSDFFDPLLLPKRGQMQRLNYIENHIRSRRAKAKRKVPSIFSDPTDNSFAVQYFNSSSHHHGLRKQIEDNAAAERNAKKVEWKTSSERYQRLMNEAKQMSCATKLAHREETMHDAERCKKCALHNEAYNMRIAVHEWPLPTDEIACKSAVMELDCPLEFAAWRNLTWMLLLDLGFEGEESNISPLAELSTYSGLSKHYKGKASRFTLASTVKPYVKAHYHDLSFPIAQVDELFVRNALRYQLFDRIGSCWVQDQRNNYNLHERCTPRLPGGPYANLQYTVESVDHSQNQVIADQGSCSQGLSLHEFLSFGSLRADGERVQWFNIKRELSASNLTFNTEAVWTLITQAAWQVGSRGETMLRKSHLNLSDPIFCKELLAVISKSLDSIGTNWKSDHAMLLLIMLILRVLSLSTESDVDEIALNLLQDTRTVVHAWTEALVSILHKTTNTEQISKLQQRLLRAAVLCRMTYDLDDDRLTRTVLTDDNVRIWVVSSFRVRENTPGDTNSLPPDLRRLLVRDRKVSHALNNALRRSITEDQSPGLDDAIRQVWSSYQRGSEFWTMLMSPNDRWLSTHTASSHERTAQIVHYNRMDGELLVDGRALGRLPMNYVESDIYRLVLGAQILHVFAADMPGMLYMSAQKLNGYLVYFGMRGVDVIIRIVKDSRVLEVVPPKVFQGDLPHTFVRGYVHWLDVNSGMIEFRPLDRRWHSDPEGWQLQYLTQSAITLSRGSRKLIDIRSKTCLAIMSIFGVLEFKEEAVVTLSGNGQLEVALLRYDLRFFLNDEGYFQCHELCKIVDPNQSIGTLIGLRTRLVLCGILPLARKHDRILLIPEGQVSVSPTGSHVEAHIAVDGSNIRLYRYQIDATLRRLQDDGDIMGTLYKAYLHAITTHTLPDPLTERTGTEEAIMYLRQQSLSFIKPPGSKATNLLSLIARLTPKRQCYPSHLRVMQQVNWLPVLSMLAQHDEFLPLAQRIVSSGDPYVIFHPASQEASDLSHASDRSLLQRANIRNSCYRSADFGACLDLKSHDYVYNNRDRSYMVERASKSFEIATIVKNWPQKLECSKSLLQDLERLSIMAGIGTKFDRTRPLFDLLEIRSHYAGRWGPLTGLCRDSFRVNDTYSLLFLFSAIAYGRDIPSLTMLQTILAFAFVDELKAISPIPKKYTTYNPAMGSALNDFALREAIESNMKGYNGPSGKNRRAEREEGLAKHKQMCNEQTEIVIGYYRRQWPTDEPNYPVASLAPLLRYGPANTVVSQLFHTWMANREYCNYLNQVQLVLNEVYERSSVTNYMSKDWHLFQNASTYLQDGSLAPSLGVLISRDPPAQPPKLEVPRIDRERGTTKKNEKLEQLITAVGSDGSTQSNTTIRTQYRDDLLASYHAFSSYQEFIKPSTLSSPVDEVILNRTDCERYMTNSMANIRSQLDSSKDPVSRLLELGGLWPRLTLRTLLGLVSTISPVYPNQSWKACILALGKVVTALQRARRLVLAAETNDVSTFSVEMENEGHVGWDVSTWPDWLLMEIESDFLIRPIQARVALEMIQPSSSASSLVQLNMGEGKSSVIVPLVAVAIADGSRLSRVVVLKSLVKQMSDTISQRLGGLVDRQIFFMPFSRKVKIDAEIVAKIQSLQHTCLERGGILLSQPEHILSFKLMGIERLTSGELRIAAQLMQSQQWLEAKARDILDESDELLDVKFQLIYSLGSQCVLDGGPDRWVMTQQIFDLIERHVAALEEQYPKHVEIKYRSTSSFPHLRLLSAKVGRRLVQLLAQDVVDSRLPGLNFEGSPAPIKETVLRFIHDREVSDQDCLILKSNFSSRESFMQKLLLVRGLLAYKILLFVLRNKRWLVNYGLHPSRCLSAVPYRAKGVPAQQAEFAFPDVFVTLTILSYYYSGLTNIQIRQTLQLLAKADDPSLEYASWTRKCTNLPQYLRSWTAVNLEDDQMCHEVLFPQLRYGKKVADYFMTCVVFPKEGKEFHEKLSTSGWDIVSETKTHITTGFSGTNDNRFVLPLSISQQDLPELRHTSGKVLDFVLREENLAYHLAQDSRGRQLSSEGLIRYITQVDSSVKVILDVGAQVLDTSNRDFVKAWMKAVPDVEAAVFFSEEDVPMILTRHLMVEKLSVSSFQKRLDRCVIYLDEVHTRGTDLKLPATMRAAVTLGPRLTKDRLVQACMRLRKLAQGQTLMFLAPPEVHKQIVKLSGNHGDTIDGYDVVAWALEQSCQSIERYQPLRILQGLTHCQRQAVMKRFDDIHPDLNDLDSVEADSNTITAFKEKEEQSLNDLYAPPFLETKTNPSIAQAIQASSDSMVQILVKLWKGLGSVASAGASMHEEHEREVAHEVQQEIQIERPPGATPLDRSVDPSLPEFVRTGRLTKLMEFSLAYDRIIPSTSRELMAPLHPWMHLRVTRDFTRTVQQPNSEYHDSYLRPVNWLLTSKQEVEPKSLLLISQFEANELLREIQSPKSGVLLHIYEPRVTKSMGSVDFGIEPAPLSMEEWQCLSSGLRRELNLFAGQLYFNTYDDYKNSYRDLGPRLNVDVDETLSFVRAWIALRRKGQDFNGTHLGQMVDGRSLTEEAFR